MTWVPVEWAGPTTFAIPSFEKSHKTNLPNWKDDENFDIFIHVLRHPSYLFYYYSSMSASRLSLSVICELRVPFFFISLMLLLWRHSLFCFWGWWIFYSLMGWLGTLITKPLENFWYYMISWFFFSVDADEIFVFILHNCVRRWLVASDCESWYDLDLAFINI